MAFCFEKTITDREVLQSVAGPWVATPADADAIGFDAIAEVGPRGDRTRAYRLAPRPAESKPPVAATGLQDILDRSSSSARLKAVPHRCPDGPFRQPDFPVKAAGHSQFPEPSRWRKPP